MSARRSKKIGMMGYLGKTEKGDYIRIHIVKLSQHYSKRIPYRRNQELYMNDSRRTYERNKKGILN